jgi:hypothetical protein
MGTRGKKSTAGLTVQVIPTLRQRLPVPAELTPEQGEIWRTITGCRPVDWFDAGSAPLLMAYCRTVAAQGVLAGAIDAFDPGTIATEDGSATYRRLLALQEVQTKLAIKLATSMRLSQHSRHHVRAAATAARDGQSAASAARLWDEA